jgi:hypothetical protein
VLDTKAKRLCKERYVVSACLALVADGHNS